MPPAVPAPAPAPLSWGDVLDALEEHHRRCADWLSGGDGAPPDVGLRADGPVPPELRVRAELVREQARRLEERVRSRRETVQRARHYGAR